MTWFICGWADGWDYKIRAFYPHGRGLAIETVHKGEASRDVEISAFKERMKAGEIAYIEVIELNPPHTITVLYE